MPDLLNTGPIQFSVQGTFMDKPRLLMDGEDVPYENLSVAYMAEETYEYNGVKETLPEYISLSFSLKGKVGQLEANVSYRVKANADGKFVVEQTEDIVHAAKKPPFPPKKKKDDKKKDGKDAPKDGEKKGEKPDFKKFKKGKSSVVDNPDAGTREYKKNLYSAIVENLLEDE